MERKCELGVGDGRGKREGQPLRYYSFLFFLFDFSCYLVPKKLTNPLTE